MQKSSSVEQQFTKLYHENKNAIFNYILYRTGFDRQLAEDLTSEIFIKAFEHFDRYDSSRPFKTWIFTIAHNHLVNYFVSRKTTLSLDDAQEVPQNDKGEMDLDQKLLMEKILHLVNRLPRDKRELVLMRYVHDMSYEEIAEILGKQEGTIRTGISRAIANLRDAYNVSLSPTTPLL